MTKSSDLLAALTELKTLHATSHARLTRGIEEIEKILRRDISDQTSRAERVAADERFPDTVAAQSVRPPAPKSDALPAVCFVPFWTPVEEHASSRLRACYIQDLFRNEAIKLDSLPDSAADAIVITQLATEATLRNIRVEQCVIYDLCDPYFLSDKHFTRDGDTFEAKQRCIDIIQRADLLLAPSQSLKALLSDHFPDKPCLFIPEPIDYRDIPSVPRVHNPHRVLWFGNPANGNFESAEWMLAIAWKRFGYEPLIISKRKYFETMPVYLPFVVEWSKEQMAAAFASAAVCVLAHPPDQHTKSPNRLVTAAAHHVPTIAAHSPEYEQLLRESDCAFAYVDDEPSFLAAFEMLLQADQKKAYLNKIRAVIQEVHGQEAIKAKYLNLFTEYVGKRSVLADGPGHKASSTQPRLESSQSPVAPMADEIHQEPAPVIRKREDSEDVYYIPNLDQMSDSVNTQLVDTYGARLRILGEREAGVNSSTKKYLDEERLVRPRDLTLAKLVPFLSMHYDRCYVMRAGLGALPFLLASAGVRVVAVEQSGDRIASIEAAMRRIGVANTSLKQFLTVSRTLIAEPVPGERSLAIMPAFTFTDRNGSYELVYSVRPKYSGIIYQPEAFLRIRESEEDLKEVEARLRRSGFAAFEPLKGRMMLATRG